MDPRVENRNTVTRCSMASYNVYGKERKLPSLDTFNIIFVNVRSYDKSLPDPMAFVSILFKLPTDERNSLMRDRFNIDVEPDLATWILIHVCGQCAGASAERMPGYSVL